MLYVWKDNILKRQLFENDDLTIISDFPERVFLKHKSKMTGVSCVFTFFRRSVNGKHLIGFQSEISLKLLLRSVERAWL